MVSYCEGSSAPLPSIGLDMSREVTLTVELPEELADRVESQRSAYDVVLKRSDERRDLPTDESVLGT